MWKKIKEKLFTKQFLTFGIIGFCNTFISQSLYIVFVSSNWAAGIASFIADVLSMVFSYFANMRFTYRRKPSWKSAITFPISYLPGIILTTLVVVFVVNCLHAPKIYAKLVSLPITIPLNYFCMNKIVNKFGGKSIQNKDTKCE